MLEATNLIAWYGAIVATVAIIISAWVAWRSRVRIMVSGLSGYRTEASEPYDPDKTYLLITVSNPGRRPSTIAQVGLSVREGSSEKRVLAADKGPQVLAGGESSYWIMEYGQDTNLPLENIKYVWASDDTGKMYTGKVKHIK